jgi:hypothetical protein
MENLKQWSEVQINNFLPLDKSNSKFLKFQVLPRFVKDVEKPVEQMTLKPLSPPVDRYLYTQVIRTVEAVTIVETDFTTGTMKQINLTVAQIRQIAEIIDGIHDFTAYACPDFHH